MVEYCPRRRRGRRKGRDRVYGDDGPCESACGRADRRVCPCESGRGRIRQGVSYRKGRRDGRACGERGRNRVGQGGGVGIRRAQEYRGIACRARESYYVVASAAIQRVQKRA